ncbi:MAG: peptidyl-prolyl cis-trans isomerase [Verrucomicrobiota bacterium]
MITILRKHRNWLMIVIAILCIPFIFYFSKTDFSAQSLDRFGRIYDRNIMRVEVQRNVRLFELAQRLGMYPLLQELIGNATSQDDAYLQFTVNRAVLAHEAERLGIRPTTSEILDVVKGIRVFQGEANFDINKYNDFVQNTLPSMGFNEAQIEELAGDQLRLDRIKSLLAIGVQIPESESKSNFEQAYGKMDVTLVRLRNEDFTKNIQITDPDVAKYYEAHKAELKSEEKRKVEFASFAFTDEQKKLAGKERIDALQKLADRANDFSQALLEKGADFKQVAAKSQVPVKTTGDFTVAAPDPQFAASPELGKSAFRLTKQEPYGDAIQTADGFYILHLAAIEEARPLTIEEAKPKIVEALRKERLQELMSAKVAEATQQIREKLKTGATPEVAIQQAGLKPEKIPPFSLLEDPIPKLSQSPSPGASPSPEQKPTPDLPAIKQSVAELHPGEVSPFLPTADGGLIAVLEKREPLDMAKFELSRPLLDSRVLQNKRTVVFQEWLAERRREAGVALAKT